MGGRFRQNPMLGGGIANTRSLPATHRLYNPSSLDIPDAADGLADKSNLPSGATGAGVLLTADGGRYPGELFGAQAIGTGELVFTTGMMGYQESLTDPSFAGQVLTFTYPLIGNYGVHIGASESGQVWLQRRGRAPRHASTRPSPFGRDGGRISPPPRRARHSQHRHASHHSPGSKAGNGALCLWTAGRGKKTK